MIFMGRDFMGFARRLRIDSACLGDAGLGFRV